jgi:hypothetical protein
MGLLVFWRPQLDITEDHVQKFAPRRSCWKTQPGVNGAKLGKIWGDLLSRRDGAIVAWHEVPGERVPPKNRPVGYGMIGPSESQIYFSSECAPGFLRKANTLLERFVSNDVRAAARWNGPFPEPARIGAHTCTNHTVPYGTALLGGSVPGTSCQATITQSLRDISQQALAVSKIG